MAVASTPEPARPIDLAPLAMLVNLQTASVPGFAPVGLDAERYGEWLHGATPVPEVVAHHATHHPTTDHIADLASQVHASDLDVAAMVALARELGAGELIAIATDPDGGTWPIAARLLDTARAAGLRTGLALDPARVASTLVEALVPDTVRWLGAGDGSTPSLGEGRNATRLVDARRTLPDVAPDRPWELRLGAGPSLGWNRAEAIEDLRTPRQLVDRFARTIADGGRLVLDIPIRPDGSVSPLHLDALRAAAPWFAHHAARLHGYGRFDVDGDDTVRYLAKAGPDKGQRSVAIVDLTAAPDRSIAHFSPHRYPVIDVEGATSWEQDPAGIHLAGLTDDGLPNLVVLTVTDRRLVRLSVQGRRSPGAVTIDDVAFPGIGAALAAARPGDVVRVGAGRYGSDGEPLPLHVPTGVTLSGPEPPDVPAEVRKHLPDPPTAELVGLGTLLVVDAPDVRVAHLHLTAEDPADAPVLRAEGARGLVVEHCTIVGRVAIADADDLAVRWTNIDAGGLDLDQVRAARVVGGRITGTAGHRPSIALDGCDDVRVEAVAITDAEVAVQVARSRDVVVGACALLASHTAILVDGATDVEIAGNRMRAMRAVHVRASHAVAARSNGVERADTVVLIEGDRTDVAIDGNRVATAREPLLVVETDEI
jgi:hypothetical protein